MGCEFPDAQEPGVRATPYVRIGESFERLTHLPMGRVQRLNENVQTRHPATLARIAAP